MAILANHSQRFALNDERHARPLEALQAPERAPYLAVCTEPDGRQAEYEHIVELCTRYGVASPGADLTHFQVDVGVFRLRWEHRPNCSSYTFFRHGDFETPFADPVIGSVPQDWLEKLPGTVRVAAHMALRAVPPVKHADDELTQLFEGNPVNASRVGDGVASVVTDFRIHADGFSRILIDDIRLTPDPAGRTVLVDADAQLAALITETAEVHSKDEPALLDRLTRLAATVEGTISATLYRICTARAHQELVTRRIAELREQRVEGLPTLREFVERRLLPAINTCETVARMQLRLQETVEGLSIAAISYYVAGLIAYLAKALKAGGAPVNPEIVVGPAIPVVVIAAAVGVRHIRRAVQRAKLS